MGVVDMEMVQRALNEAGRNAVANPDEIPSGRYTLSGTDYTFMPTGGPIDEPEKHAVLFEKLGLAMASWSRMEQMLLNLTVHMNKAGSSAFNPALSHNFKDLTETLEKCLSERPDIYSTVDMFTQLRELSDVRNKIAHGLIDRFDEESQTFTLKMVSRKGKDVWGYISIDYDIRVLDLITNLANGANKYFVAVAKDVFSNSKS